MKPEIIQTQSWRYKTIVVIKRQQQTTISNKQVISSFVPGGCCVTLQMLMRAGVLS